MSIMELQKLEQQNIYLFHGSGSNISEFEPRQAYTRINDEKVPDGIPAVFASLILNYAIFMALISKENFPKGYRARVDFNNGNLVYNATKETIEKIHKDISGYVYVFHKNDFEEKNPYEYFSKKHIKPIKIFRVTMGDFLSKIEEI